MRNWCRILPFSFIVNWQLKNGERFNLTFEHEEFVSPFPGVYIRVRYFDDSKERLKKQALELVKIARTEAKLWNRFFNK